MSDMTPHVYAPRWTQELLTLYDGEIARQFVLHFNITDFVVELDDEAPAPELGLHMRTPAGQVVGQVRSFRDYLHAFLRLDLSCQAIYSYSLASGLLADEDLARDASTPLATETQSSLQRVSDAFSVVAPRRQSQAGQPAEGREVNLPNDTMSILKTLGHMLRQRYGQDGKPLPEQAEARTPQAPIAVILDYAEKLIPFRLGESQGDREQLQSLETVQRWALDPRIRGTQNIVILLTTNIGQIAPSVFAGGSQCRAIRVPLPNRHERKAYIQWRMDAHRFITLDQTAFGGAEPEQQATRLAHSTQGMRLIDIDNLSKRVWVERRMRNEPPIMQMDDVQREKAEVIQAQSEQLLEIQQPRRGFEEIGGLKKLKDYLRLRTGQMTSGQHTPLVPSGLLLAGPPGTGKTIIAEALATQSGFNLVKMRNIREKWVGSSERNLDLALNLLKDLHPVVVFVDEIDQAMGRRDTGQDGDSGVGARMFGRILEEMSNADNRGKILWVAATNRADLLDDALLRRFDRVVPLLTPDVDEAERIFATMPTMLRKQSDQPVNIFYAGTLNGPSDDLSRFKSVAEAAVKSGLTGAGIEIVVRRAAEIACEDAIEHNQPLSDKSLPGIEESHLQRAIWDYEPNHNSDTYDLQSLLAIRACNFDSVMPDFPDRELFHAIRGNDGKVDRRRLEAEIRRLRLLVGGGSGVNLADLLASLRDAGGSGAAYGSN